MTRSYQRILWSKAGMTALAALGLAAAPAHAQSVFTTWTFNNNAAATNTTPAPSTGSGNASTLGMTNGYSYPTGTGSTDGSDILLASAKPTKDGASSDPGTNIWRIRGAGGGGNNGGNGWNSAAPQYSQGAQFTTSTVGEANVIFTFDWAETTQGPNTMQVRYTLDGTTYQNYTGTVTGKYTQQTGTTSPYPVNITPETFSNGLLVFPANAMGDSSQYWLNQNTVDFSSILGASSNPNFGIELVSAFAPSAGTYEPNSGTGGLNNSSGNWRFDNVKFSGTTPASAPEPSGMVALAIGVGALGLLLARRRKASALKLAS